VVDEVVVRFVAEDVPGLGYTAYVIDPCSGAEGTPLTPMDAPSVSAGAPTVLENEFLRATVQADGRIDLLDKTSGQEVTDAVDLVDEADAGHSYLFMRLDGDRPRVLSKDTAPAVEWLDNGIYSRALQVSYRVSLPADLAARRGTATEDQQVEMPIRLTLRLDTGSPRLDVQVDLDNRVSNHRLRLVVHSDVQTDESLSSAPFDLVTRNRVSDHNGILHDPVQPNSGMITVQAEGRGMSLFTDGLYEYEHLMGERGSLALTLVRGTGVISHNEGGRSAEYADLPQPREWLCPGNQCLRPLSLRLAILPGPRDPVWLQNRFLEFLVPMMPYFDSVNESKFSGGRPCVQDSEVQETFYRPIPVEQRHLPRQTQAFAVEGDSVVLSAVKRAEDGKRWILRVYNPTDQAGEARVRVNGDQAWILRLDETPVQELAPVDGTVTVTVPGKGITTIGCTH
jgi:alpha-mannosidase